MYSYLTQTEDVNGTNYTETIQLPRAVNPNSDCTFQSVIPNLALQKENCYLSTVQSLKQMSITEACANGGLWSPAYFSFP